MKPLLLCFLLIALVLSHPVQDKIKSKEHEYTCNYLKNHLEFLEVASASCHKKDLDISGIQRKYCEKSGEEVVKKCATDQDCLNDFLKNVNASEMLEKCACAGLTKAVTKLSDFTEHLCDDNRDIRDGKLFLDITHWNDKLDFIHDWLGSKAISSTESDTDDDTTTVGDGVMVGAGPEITNIDIALKGYDAVIGDSLDERYDPGFKAQIFEYWNAETGRYYDFIDTRPSSRCVKGASSTTSRTYEQHENSRTGMDEHANDISGELSGSPLPLFKISFKASRHHEETSEYSQEKRFFSSAQGQVYQSYARCEVYNVIINDFNVPVFVSGFINGVKELHEASVNPDSHESEQLVKKFWNTFGTHFMSTAHMGGSLSVESRWASNSVSNSASSERSRCVQNSYEVAFGGSGGQWNASAGVEYGHSTRNCKSNMENSEFFNQGSFSETKITTRGGIPKSDTNAWAETVRQHPEVIGLELKSIGELFSDANLAPLNIANLNSARLRQFYADKLKRYCEIKLGKSCDVPKGCNIKGAAPSCPNDQLCVNEPNGFRCEENKIPISRNSCSWRKATHFGEKLKCNEGEVPVGACSSGKNKDCDGGTSAHKLKCCHLGGFAYDNCTTSGSWYGAWKECKNIGAGLVPQEQCHSGEAADCVDWNGRKTYNTLSCCQARINYKLVSADLTDCHTGVTVEHGQDFACPDNMVIVGRCGSGRDKDCFGNSHATQCCRLKYVGWPLPRKY